MYKKQLGSIILIAGISIGSGMIALPMVLAKLGLIPSIMIMFVIWGVIYYSSLVNLELNLQANKGLPLNKLGRLYSGKGAEAMGFISLKLLSYSLLSVYIYGGASVLQKLLSLQTDFTLVASIIALIVSLILLLPLNLIDHLNRALFAMLLFIIAVLVLGLVSMINWSNLPLIGSYSFDIKSLRIAIPVLFTSFGFQIIFHTLTDYCNKNGKILKKAFFIGSLIPFILYIIWTSSILSVVYNENYEFYHSMELGKVEVGDLIKELSKASKWPLIQILIWWISLLAIVTSVIGVGVGLKDSIKKTVTKYNNSSMMHNILASIVTILPAYLVAVIIPNAFIKMLGFAGMILVIIAILLPIYLFYKAKIKKLYYQELRLKLLIAITAIIGIIIILCEIFNILGL
jgi:tyrosine-specific transport protein